MGTPQLDILVRCLNIGNILVEPESVMAFPVPFEHDTSGRVEVHILIVRQIRPTANVTNIQLYLVCICNNRMPEAAFIVNKVVIAKDN